MTVGEQVTAALAPLGLPLAPGVYSGTAETYMTYNYSLVPMSFGDDRAMWYRALVQVHLAAPPKTPLTPLAARVMRALVKAGFTAPELVPAHEADRQHVVLECEVAVPASDILMETEAPGCGCGGGWDRLRVGICKTGR